MTETKHSIIRRVGFVLEAVAVIPMGKLVSLAPWKGGRVLADLFGRFMFHLSRKARDRAGRNLDILFADAALSPAEKDRIIRRLFVNFATSAYEYLRIGRITGSNCLDFVRLENPEAFYRAVYAEEGFLVVSAHLGNWEIGGSIPAKLGKDMGAVIHRQLNPYTDRWLRRIRERRGKIKCFYDEVPDMRRMVAHLRSGGTLAILADEHQTQKPVYLPFFGKQASAPDGPARLHFLCRVPILLFFAIRQDDGRYLLTLDGPYRFERKKTLKEDCLREKNMKLK